MLLRNPHRLFAVPFVLLALALVAGCGSSSESDSTAASTGAAAASDTTAAAGDSSTSTTGAAGFKCSEDGAITDADWNKGAKQLPDPPDPSSLKGKKIAYIGFGQDNVYSQWMFKAIKCQAEEWGRRCDVHRPAQIRRPGAVPAGERSGHQQELRRAGDLAQRLDQHRTGAEAGHRRGCSGGERVAAGGTRRHGDEEPDPGDDGQRHRGPQRQCHGDGRRGGRRVRGERPMQRLVVWGARASPSTR